MSNGQEYYGSGFGAGSNDGFLGGGMGDGQVFGTQRPQFGQQQQPQPQPQGTPNPYGPSNAPYQTPQPGQQQPSPGYPAGAGSITRFATPQQYGSPLYPQSSPYNFQPPPQPGASSNSMMSGKSNNFGGMSYTERAAMLQQQGGSYSQPSQTMYGGQPQVQHQPAQQQNMYGSQAQPVLNAAGMSYAQRSAAIQQNQPQRSNVYGSVPQQQPSYYGQQQYQQAGSQQVAPAVQTSSMMGMPQQQQPTTYPGTQQPQPPPQYGSVQPQPPPQYGSVQPQTPPQYGSVQPQPPPQYGSVQPQQPPKYGGAPQPTMSNLQQPGMGQSQQQGSYAQRSAMVQSQMGGPGMQQQQQPGMPVIPQQPPGMPQQPGMHPSPNKPGAPNMMIDPPEVVAQQNRLLTEATRKVQEHAYYMKQAMERNDLPTVLDRAASMVGELGENSHHHHHHHMQPPAPGATGSTTALSPKNYYELHLRALEELPTLEDYLLNIAQGTQSSSQGPSFFGGPTNQLPMPPSAPGAAQPGISYSMKELYDCVQYCPNVLSRLYLQVCAASALIRSGQVGARWVLKDMIEAVKCVQNPVRGLFLRHYLLQAFRDKLPNDPILIEDLASPEATATLGEKASATALSATSAPVVAADVTSVEKGTVKDSYEFILANFIEMNKLWVRIQHLPGDGKSKEVRRRREKDRNELRILVGTNLVRLSALDSITSTIYGQVILPTVLDHIVICGDPLAQAYLIDCIVQVFPDEYHIETLPILLGVCPKLRDKVNIRTILQSLMDRLANYLADEELLDEKDSNQVKRSMARDSFQMFDECVQKVYNARGPKLQAKEVIRLQTALLSFTMKCFQGNLDQVTICLNHCVVALQQASANQALMEENRLNIQPPRKTQLDDVATQELEKLLSIPLDELALGVLSLDHYADLIGFLPWGNRRQVALTMLEAVSKAGKSPKSVKEIEELFSVIAPVLRDEFDVSTHQMSVDATERTTNLMANLGVSPNPPRQYSQGESFNQEDSSQYEHDSALVSKLIHLLDHSDTDVLFEMYTVARNHLNSGKRQRTTSVYVALVFASLKLARRILNEETGETELKAGKCKKDGETIEVDAAVTPATENGKRSSENAEFEQMKTQSEDTKVETVEKEENELAETKVETVEEERDEKQGEEICAAGEKFVEGPPSPPKSISCRKVFIFIQQTIAILAKGNPETGVKLYLESALTADKFWSREGAKVVGQEAFGQITYEFISQSFALYEEHSAESRLQRRCIVAMIGTLLSCQNLSKEDYESLIMKTAQYAAKMLKKPDQCAMVALCSHLFYVVGERDEIRYNNAQRGLECLQRALKLADACTNANPGNVELFVDLLDHYLFFFEKNNPVITGNYITGLVALIKEHTDNLGQFGGVDPSSVGEAKSHFLQIVRHIKKMKEKPDTAEHFAAIDLSSVST